MDSGQDESADRPASGAGAGAPSPGTEHDAAGHAGGQGDPTRSDESAAGSDAGERGAPFGADSEFGPPVSEFGPSLNDFGPPVSVFGSGADTFGAPSTEFGAPVAEFGSTESDFGPPTGQFRQVPDAPVAGWTPAPVPASPELAWRPADGTPPPAAPEYLAPDSSMPYPGDVDALYGNGIGDSGQTVRYGAEETVRYDTAPESPAPKKSGWATGGGIKTSQIGRESAWLRSAESGMPESDSAAPQQESLSWADDPLTKMLMPKKAETGKGGTGKGGSKQESLSWSDDSIVQRLAPKTAASQSKPKKSWMPIAVGAGALVLIAVVALVVVSLTRGDSGTTDDAQAAFGPGGTVTTAAPSSIAALSCPAKRDGALTIGNGPGGTDSGTAAILGFQHAFYADRDGAKARSFVAPDSPTVSPAETIQQAINEVIPKGTSYCLRITDLGAEAFDADLTEHRPDGTTTVYRQRIITVNKDGRHLIFTIDER